MRKKTTEGETDEGRKYEDNVQENRGEHYYNQIAKTDKISSNTQRGSNMIPMWHPDLKNGLQLHVKWTTFFGFQSFSF